MLAWSRPLHAKILVADHDSDTHHKLSSSLAHQNQTLTSVESAAELRSRLAEQSPDLVVMDPNFADADALGLTREVCQGQRFPVILVSQSDSAVDKVLGLELGADDYLTKPFDPRELLARVRSLLRRSSHCRSMTPSQSSSSEFRLIFQGWQLDRLTQSLISPEGEEIRLTTREFRLLSLFMERPNSTLSRESLAAGVSGKEWESADRGIDVLISKLRKKIEGIPSRPQLIKTVRGEGYRLVADALIS